MVARTRCTGRRPCASSSFPSPKEFALGLSMGHPEGAGIGPDLALDICRGLDLFRRWGRNADDRLLGMVVVIVHGLGVDRISDMVSTSSKHRFVVYTQAICLGLGVPAEDVTLNNSGWTAQGSRWKHARVPLPKSPAFDGAILLAPKRFLKDIPRVTAEGFWTWATQNENETLRFELNYDLGESLTRREKALRGAETCSPGP
jgi:hypothetical protein